MPSIKSKTTNTNIIDDSHFESNSYPNSHPTTLKTSICIEPPIIVYSSYHFNRQDSSLIKAMGLWTAQGVPGGAY